MLAKYRFDRRTFSRALLVVAIQWVLTWTTAFAGDATVREIQRLLWALDYGAVRLDGLQSADTKARASKFLADRKKDTAITDNQLLSELNAAFDERKEKALKPAGSSEIIDRRGLTKTFSDSTKMVVSSEDNLVLSGSCPINRFRLSDSAPLREHRGGCQVGSFVYSQPLSLIVSDARWGGSTYGLIISDAKSGLLLDFIEVPDSLFLSKMSIHPNGKEVIVLTNLNVWRVDLQTRLVTRVSQIPKNVTEGVRFSADGRFFAASWSSLPKFAKSTVVWEFSTGKRVHEASASHAVFSADGRLIALNLKGSTVEVREIVGGKLIAKRKFESSPEFRYSDESVAFDRAGTSLLYFDSDALVLREWNFATGADRDRQKLNSKADRAVISDGTGKLYTLEDSRVLTYDLQKAGVPQAAKLSSLKIEGGAVSPDRKFVAAFSAEEIAMIDLSTGGVRSVASPGLSSISALAFMPSSDELLVGSGEGQIVRMSSDGSGRKDVVKIGTSEIKVLITARSGSLAAAISDSKVFIFDAVSGRIQSQTSCNCYGATSNSTAFVDNDQRLLFTDKYTATTLDVMSGRRVLSQEMKSNIKRQGTRTTWMWGSIAFIIPKSKNSGAFWVGGKSFGSDILYEYSNGQLKARRGSPEGTTSFYAAGAAAADSMTDGSLAVVLRTTPKVIGPDDDQFSSQYLELRDDPIVLRALEDNRFVTLDRSGEIRIYSRRSEEPVIRTLLYTGGNWLSRTEGGFFAGTREATENLYLALGTGESVSLDNLFNALYRPDLVMEAAMGDPQGKVKGAAAKLDLQKVMASGSAPKVTIVMPVAKASSATDEVAVEANVSDQGGGIGKVEWRVNGVTSGIETRGLERVEAAGSAGRSLTVKRSLALERGENRIEVLAYNAKDLIASEPASVTVTWDGEKTATPPKLYVLAVGVNDYYDSRLRLSYAVPDANAIADGFRKAGTGLYAAVDVTTVLDTDVTIANLDKVFTELGKRAQPRDVFVFFLAGHGKTRNGRYYFLPRDFRYEDEESIEKAGMDQDRFQAWFARIPARKSILLYDTCESGSLTGTKARGSDIDERLGALNRMTRATGRTFLTATTDDAPALEGYRGHGVFTYALLDALDHADVNKNGLIEVSELADYIDQKVPDLSFEAFKLRQIPQRNIVGNNFALTNKTAILAEGTDSSSKVDSARPSDAAIPAKPTHVVVSQAPVDVFVAATRGGAVVQKLPPGTMVTLIESANGWQLIAKDGQMLGFVEEKALLRLQ